MKILLIILSTLLLFQTCSQLNPNDNIIGVKIYNYQGSFDPLFDEWKSIGINTAFVSKELLENDGFRTGAAANQIKTFVILPIFFDDEALTKNPEL